MSLLKFALRRIVRNFQTSRNFKTVTSDQKNDTIIINTERPPMMTYRTRLTSRVSIIHWVQLLLIPSLQDLRGQRVQVRVEGPKPGDPELAEALHEFRMVLGEVQKGPGELGLSIPCNATHVSNDCHMLIQSWIQ